MSVYFVKYLYVGRHRGDMHPHRLFDIDIRTDFKTEQISLWNFGSNYLTKIPFHKGYLCSEPFKKGKTLCLKLNLTNLTLKT